jgi:hypothetical protein
MDKENHQGMKMKMLNEYLKTDEKFKTADMAIFFHTSIFI